MENNIDNRETVTGTFSRLAPWTLGARFIVMIMAIVTMSVLTRTMTRAEWDNYSLLWTMFRYVWMLGGLGLSEAALRFGSELSAHGDTKSFKKLLFKLASLQLLSMAGLLVAFYLLGGAIDYLFERTFGFALMVMVILGGVTMFKETLRQGYVAAYWVKMVALMSVVGAAAFPVAAYLYIAHFKWGAAGGLAAEATGYAFMIVVFGVGLTRLKFRAIAINPEDREPVTTYRVARYSGAILANNAMTLVLGGQMTIFLVGYFLRDQEGAVGILNLAAQVPGQGMSFLMLAIIPLLTAMITKSYYQDKSRLPELLRSYYKLLTIMIIPLLALGLMFIDQALEFLSGERGVEAGWMATALLPQNAVFILLVPISAGMNVLEKAQRLVVPRVLSGIGRVGLMVLALYLWADLTTVVVTSYIRNLVFTPVIMYLAVKLVGGFYFPYRFFGRTLITCSTVVLLYPLRFLWPHAQACGLNLTGAKFVGEAVFLAGASIIAFMLMAAAARLTGLFRSEEIKYFLNAKFPGVGLLMKLLVQKRYRP